MTPKASTRYKRGTNAKRVRKPKAQASFSRDASDEIALEQGYYVDAAKGQRVCDFVETFCRQSKGRWAGQPIKLLAWQRDYLMRLFGWRAQDGTRRFRTTYLEVAKKNGKSTLISALAILLLVADDAGPEVYLNAVDREQASIVYDEAAKMVKASPELQARLEVVASRGVIVNEANNGRLKKNSADAPSKDGVNASASIFDELHRFKSRALWDVFEYAGAAREQPLRIVITTAGEDASGVWHEQREYSEKVRDGVIPDPRHLGVVYRADPADDLDDPATWHKANPSLGVTISEDDFRRDLERAKRIPSEWANFKRLRLNIVAAGDAKFLRLESWDACSAAPCLGGDEPSYIGIDLSDTQDLSAVAHLRGNYADGFDLMVHFYLPLENIADLEMKHGLPYREWADRGLITLTPGNVIDYEFIRADVVAIASKSSIRKVLIDPYNATRLGIELKEQDGLPVEFLRQGFLSLSSPTKELERIVLGRMLRHGGSPLLRNHASNAVVVKDAAGNIKLHKGRSQKKIDGMAATVNAVAGLLLADPSEHESVYDQRGILFL